MRLYVLIPFIFAIGATEQGCPKNIPLVDQNIYVGDENEGALVRKKTGEKIYPHDKKFGQMICRTKEREDCNFETYISNCQSWKPQQTTCGLHDPENP